jgi:hypothetical protein
MKKQPEARNRDRASRDDSAPVDAAHRSAEITEQLNRMYAEEDGSLDPAFRRLQQRAIGPEYW